MARPKIKFDLDQVEACGRLACTYAEVADVLGCSLSTVKDRMGDEDSEFSTRYKKGLAEAKMSLRRKQIELALEGNATMLVWLGKQLLGQTDKMAERVQQNAPEGFDVRVYLVEPDGRKRELEENGTEE